MNDPELYRNTLTVPSPYTQQDADKRLEKAAGNRILYGMPTEWAIRHATDGVIGGVGAFMKQGLDGHLDEIGYWLAAPFRAKGIMTTVIKQFVDWQFSMRPALIRLEAEVYAHNPASVRVLEKSGFEQEGYLRKYAFKNGEAIDVILLSRLRPD